jgi:hypothetical protein
MPRVKKSKDAEPEVKISVSEPTAQKEEPKRENEWARTKDVQASNANMPTQEQKPSQNSYEKEYVDDENNSDSVSQDHYQVQAQTQQTQQTHAHEENTKAFSSRPKHVPNRSRPDDYVVDSDKYRKLNVEKLSSFSNNDLLNVLMVRGIDGQNPTLFGATKRLYAQLNFINDEQEYMERGKNHYGRVNKRDNRKDNNKDNNKDGNKDKYDKSLRNKHKYTTQFRDREEPYHRPE